MAQVVAVFTQPDRPVGRGQKLQPNAIKTWALERGLQVLQPEKLTDEVRLELAALAPDIALVMAYGHILRDEFINTPRLGTLNLHTSLLPKYRGASPIQTAIACGEKETAVTLMRIVRRLDAGPVADHERVEIGHHDTALDLEAKLAQGCVPLICRALPKLVSGELSFLPQDEAAATFCRKLEKTDGVLDFTQAAARLAARINGLYPWPSCSAEIAGTLVKMGLADAVESDAREAGATPGQILGRDPTALRVATRRGVLRLLRLQRPGGRMLAADEFLRGFDVAPGTVLASRPMPSLLVVR